MADSIPLGTSDKYWYYSPTSSSGTYLQNSGSYLQGGSGVQSTGSVQSTGQVQSPTSPMQFVDPEDTSLAVQTQPALDPAAQAAAAEAARQAAIAQELRGSVTNLVNSVKSLFDARYGMVDAAAGEQATNLNTRYAGEVKNIGDQVNTENQKIGAAHSAAGTYDSSYRGNNVDTVTKAGNAQIGELGTELKDNLSKVGGWAAQQKAGFNSEKGSMDLILSRLAETTDVNELTSLRNSIESKLQELNAGQAEYATNKQNLATLETVAPSSARAQQLKTTLSQILTGNASAQQKSAIANTIVTNAGLTEEEQQALLNGFSNSLSQEEKKQA